MKLHAAVRNKSLRYQHNGASRNDPEAAQNVNFSRALRQAYNDDISHFEMHKAIDVR